MTSDIQEKATALLEKLRRGVDAESLAQEFVALRPVEIPSDFVVACSGNRSMEVKPCPRALRALLQGRADPNGRDRATGGPVLHAACWNGSVEVVSLLLDFKADIESRDPRFATPALNTALAAGNAPVCLELLRRRADVAWAHEDGATPLHVATAWIASSHNSHMRQPPLGEEPCQVITEMLHNGVDPTQTEGMTRNTTRGTGMTPLESFRREIARSPWRDHAEIGKKFFKMADGIHRLLEQGEQAVKLKNQGNRAFGEARYQDALRLYAEARQVWQTAGVGGHHVSVLWSNEAACHRKLEAWDRGREACQQGLAGYCSTKIRKKLEDSLAEASKELEALSAGVVKEKPPREAVPPKPATKLKAGWVEDTKDKTLYPEEGSVQGKVDKPGPFICHFEDAKEAGFVDGIDGWKDRQKRAEQALDRELVANGVMSPDLLDDPKSVQYINPLPPGTG